MMNALGSIINLTQALGIKNLAALPDAWQYKLDDQWHIAINAQDHNVAIAPPGAASVTIPPYHFAVWFNGRPAALFSPSGGQFAAGEAANEETFCQAVEKVLEGYR